MKELSIEEKAKAYDRVSKEVKDFFEGRQKMYSDVSQTLKYLFPELKESEDEKIREYLIRYIDNTMKSSELKSKLLAWLEKQGEKKPKRMISAEAKEALWNESEREALRTEYEKGRADVIAKTLEWINVFNDNNYIMHYSDSCEHSINEIIEWYKNYINRE